jgi:predicted nucleic acid-binding protein
VILIDTSVWIEILRDHSGQKGHQLEEEIDMNDVVLSSFTELELLQGCRDEKEWALLNEYLFCQDYLDPIRSTWSKAARIFFDLRRTGRTVRSPIDCCIAQLAIENDALLIHRDVDFITIADIHPLRQRSMVFAT